MFVARLFDISYRMSVNVKRESHYNRLLSNYCTLSLALVINHIAWNSPKIIHVPINDKDSKYRTKNQTHCTCHKEQNAG